MRDLSLSHTGSNLNGSKEFNHVRLTNLDEFLNSYTNNLDYYQSPFAILADLEAQVKYENNPPECITVSYKEDGDIIFNFVRMYEGCGVRYVQYEYTGSAS